MSKSSFAVVKGVLPKKIEIADWSEEKILSLLKFAWLSLRETVRHNKKELTYHYDKDFEDAIKQYDNPFFQEFVVRLTIPGASYLSLRGRLIVMVRTVLSYIKSNPHVVTQKMEEQLKATDRFSWALKNFEMKETAIGAEVVAVNDEDTTDLDRVNANPNQTGLTLPEVQYQQALLSASSLIKSLLKGIKPNDIRMMDTKDRLKIGLVGLQTLGKLFTNSKPKSIVFKNLTVNSAGKDDLEKALLSYNQEQQ